MQKVKETDQASFLKSTDKNAVLAEESIVNIKWGKQPLHLFIKNNK